MMKMKTRSKSAATLSFESVGIVHHPHMSSQLGSLHIGLAAASGCGRVIGRSRTYPIFTRSPIHCSATYIPSTCRLLTHCTWFTSRGTTAYGPCFYARGPATRFSGLGTALHRLAISVCQQTMSQRGRATCQLSLTGQHVFGVGQITYGAPAVHHSS
jgi:hypothetical protein